jgi:hypothetical protein
MKESIIKYKKLVKEAKGVFEEDMVPASVLRLMATG